MSGPIDPCDETREMAMVRHGVMVWLAALGVVAAAAEPRLAAAGRAEALVKLDGVLDEPAWANLPWNTDFVDARASAEAGGGSAPAAAQTRFKVLHHADWLYLGVECDEPRIESLKASANEHDSMVFMDDCVEVFCDPAGQGRYYYHFVVNTKGAWYDNFGADYGVVHAKLWECPLAVGTAVDQPGKRWCAEIGIPLAALNLKDAAAEWLFNVTRERYAGGGLELSTWAPLRGNFHQPKLFGKLRGVTVERSDFAVELGEPKLSVSGGGTGWRTLRLRAELANHSGRERKLAVEVGLFGAKDKPAAGEPVTLRPGESRAVDLPPVRTPADLRTAAVQLTVRDLATGRPATIVVKSLNAEYRALDLQVLQPVYRRNIHATEKLGEIVFRVLPADDIVPASVRCRLVDAKGAAVAERTFARADLAGDLRLAADKLTVGRYTLRAEALNQAGAVQAEASTAIGKLAPAPGNEVRVDQHGNVLVNGRPQVVIGWYGSVPTQDPRADVVALQNVQTPVVLKQTDVSGVRQAWEERRCYSIVSIEPVRLHYTFNLWRDPKNTVHSEHTALDGPSEECRGYLRRLVEAVQGEPGLLGYYLADEPEIHNTRSDYLEAYYAFMRELDPYHPILITNDTLDGIVTHGYRACDILAPDPYSAAWDYVPNFLRRARSVMGPGQALMLTPWHSASDTHSNQDMGSGRPYPYAVMRHQYLVSVAMGCRGFAAYTSGFFMPEPILRYGLPAIWREVRFLEPAMAAPAVEVQAKADAPVAAWCRQLDGQVTLIVVNHKPGAREVTISSPALRAVKSLDVVAEGRAVAVKDGAFTERFAEGEARIYTTDPAGRKLPTNAANERAIAEAEKAADLAGDVLHVNRGVRARAAEGYYAPWFHQYYYYAVNGIRDDDGWYCSHAGGKPSWLELTLPRPALLKLVRVVTPNLSDYDLQFTAPDGSLRVAEVRGNTAEVAEHLLNPPVTALKVRITALKTREGADPKAAMVREIEAYETGTGGVPTAVRLLSAAPEVVAYQAPEFETTGEPILWCDDFDDFQHADQYFWDARDTKWVYKPDTLNAETNPGQVTISAVKGGTAMTRILPYQREHRWFQVKLDAIAGEGYKFMTAGFADSSGKPGYRKGISTSRPGIYTLDTWYVHPSYRDGAAKKCFISLYVSATRFTFDRVQLARRPANGLAVTLTDGSPLPEALRQGDELMYRLFLDEPATDVVVETSAGPGYLPLPINGEPYVTLRRTGDGDGREWLGKVKLGPGTGKYDGAYPVFWRAVITGGKIAETYACAGLKVE